MAARGRRVAPFVALLCASMAALLWTPASAAPNVIIFLTDDQGYGDLSVAGHPSIRTPHIDRLAREGVRFTQFMSANSVCTPSRAALLTARLPVRNGMTGSLLLTMWAASQATGLQHDEVTLAEALKEYDPTYYNAVVGKWHLGINRNTSTDGYYMPQEHGFDSSYTFPVSNNPSCGYNDTTPPMPETCFVMRDKTVVEQPVVLETLPDRLTNEALKIVETYAGVRPFFLYYGFVQPHTPIFSSARFQGRSPRGPYGDAIEEIDDAVGRVMDAVRAAGQENNTIVVFTSDNGGWTEEGEDGGSNGLLRGGKAQDWEGGIRVPGIIWGPGLGIAPRISRALVSMMDVMPTILDYVGGSMPPPPTVIDGRSIRPILSGTESDAVSASSRVLFHYCGYLLHAVRYGPWKAHFVTPRITNRILNTCAYFIVPVIQGCSCLDILNQVQDPPLLYNLVLGNANDHAHPDVDPAERLPRDTVNDPLAAAALAVIIAERDKHVAELVPGPTQVDTPRYDELQPCCNPPACLCSETDKPPVAASGSLLTL